MPSSDDAAKIKEQGWRQGSVLPPSLFDTLRQLGSLGSASGDECAVIVSQDCDVVHPQYSVEPTVEVMVAVRRQSLDGNLTYTKSPRRLHMEISTDQGIFVYELSMRERFFIDRRLLSGVQPHGSIKLSNSQTRQLAGWLSKRYRRDAFPDEFVNRLRQQPQSEALRKLFKKWGGDVTAVFLLLNTEQDLPPTDLYRITVWATVPREEYEQQDKRNRLDEMFQPALEAALSAFPGLEVDGAMVVSDADFSLADVRSTRRLDLDDISYRNQGPLADATE